MNVRGATLTWLLCALLVVGCTSVVGVPSPSGSAPAPTASPRSTVGTTPTPSRRAAEVSSAAQAAALVFASNPAFASIGPLEPDMIGQAAWYEANEEGDHYSVVVTMGSGDCIAGCIDQHVWNYVVERDGTVSLKSEEGDDVELPANEGTPEPATVRVRLTAGPACPVERPGDPNCAPRAVANAEVVLRDPSGAEVGRGTTDRDGTVAFSVPGGAYYIDPAPIDDFMGQPQPVAFAVVGGSSTTVTVSYDTGIR